MRTRSHNRKQRKEKVGKEIEKTLHAKKILSSKSILTSGNLEKQLGEMNIPLIDFEDILDEEESIESDLEESEDLEGLEENEVLEDDDIDYDEAPDEDPFDREDIERVQRGIYIVSVEINSDSPFIQFLHVPLADTSDAIVQNTFIIRYKYFREIAQFIALKQKNFFSKLEMEGIKNLNQEDLVKYIQKKGYKLKKEHISRMLDSLFFRIKGMGDVPAKNLFRRYGHKTGLSGEEKLSLAIEFLKNCKEGLTQLEKAKGLWEYVRDKKGIEIKLSHSTNENNKYRNLKNIINEAQKGITLG